MKTENFRKLEAGRMYEITSVSSDNVWGSKTSKPSTILGAIISADKPARRYTPLTIHKQGAGHVHLAHPYIGLVGITFRPLNKKDQAKIEEQNRGS